MAAQLARVREMERNGELEPIPELDGGIADVTDRRTQTPQRLPGRRGLRDRGWLLVEVASVVLPALRLPGVEALTLLVVPRRCWASRSLLIAAWAFELTPEGIKREADS